MLHTAVGVSGVLLEHFASKTFLIKYDSDSFVQAFSVVLIDFVTFDACSICRTVDIDVI